MRRPDPPAPGQTAAPGSAQTVGNAPLAAGHQQQQPLLSNSLREILQATERSLPPAPASSPLGSTGASASPTDLELLLLLQRQRERLSGVNNLLLHQQQQQLPRQGFQNDRLLYGIGAGTGLNADDAVLMRQAESLLAMQQLRGMDDLSGSSGASGSLPSSFLAASQLQQQQLQQQQQQQLSVPGLPADLTAVINARLQRSHEASQQQQAVEEAKRAAKAESRSATAAAASASAASEEKADEQSSLEESDSDGDGDDMGEGEGGAGTAEGDEHDNADLPVNDTFPHKMYRMLENAEKRGQESIVSFTKDGKAFMIHKADDFVAKIMPHYFTTSRMTSFQRQLNLYGFRRISEGTEKGAYFHKYFIKGRRKLCKKIKRKKNTAKPPPVFLPQNPNPGLGSLVHAGAGPTASIPLGLGGTGLSSFGGLGHLGLRPSISGLLQQPSSLPGAYSPALLELRQQQQTQSDLMRFLLQQQQQQQDQQQRRNQQDESTNPFQRFFPPNL